MLFSFYSFKIHNNPFYVYFITKKLEKTLHYNMVLHHIGEDLDLDLRNPAFELQLLISHMLLRNSFTGLRSHLYVESGQSR